MFAIHKRKILLPSSVDMVRMFNFTDKVKEGEQDDYENINEMCVIKMLEPVMKKKAMFLTLIIKHSFEGI
ncbi:BnaC03g67770D [Brassica napus]|uniref:BnaC03g67770D protein n=1 Tax=Brassica napus TaxID=3708 RepID=A0A078HF72_BRANA|nr:BnaC03g67770D [Brassica napus]